MSFSYRLGRRHQQLQWSNYVPGPDTPTSDQTGHGGQAEVKRVDEHWSHREIDWQSGVLRVGSADSSLQTQAMAVCRGGI